MSKIASVILQCFRYGGKLMIAGNGGSAADAQHIAAEFLGSFKLARPPLPAMALPMDAATLTAIGNDFGYSHTFSRPLEALAKPGDVFLAISTSGRSANIQSALEKSKALGIKTIAFTGNLGSRFMDADLKLVIDSDDTAKIQEGYMKAAHEIVGAVERELYGQKAAA